MIPKVATAVATSISSRRGSMCGFGRPPACCGVGCAGEVSGVMYAGPGRERGKTACNVNFTYLAILNAMQQMPRQHVPDHMTVLLTLLAAVHPPACCELAFWL